MKKLKACLAFLLLLCLAGCFEVNEEITIRENGSGVYQVKMDMNQLLEMMQMMASEEQLSKEGLDKVIDTVILLKDVSDSASNLTPVEKELMKDAKMHLQMNMKEKLMKVDMDYVFKNYYQLQSLMSGQVSSTGLAKAMKNIFNKESPEPDRAVDPEMDQISKIYDITVKDGLISKKINPEKLKALLERPEMAQMKEMNTSGMEILYTTAIKLPRPVTKIDNPLLKLSEDKKTVTIKYNMLEMLEKPDKFSYSITY